MDKRAWSDLPELPLWMINGRLDMVSRLMFSAVCKDWMIASKNFPKKFKSSTNIEPWVMAETKNATERIFINFSINSSSRLAEFKFSHEEFEGARFHSSKNGWLLFSKIDEELDYDYYRFDRDTPKRDHAIFFVNPITKSTIRMPLYNTLYIRGATFTIINDVPHRVVLTGFTSNTDLTDSTTIAIANVGSNTWTEFHHQGEIFLYGITIVDEKYVVTICDYGNDMLYFDLSKLVWVLSPFQIITRKNRRTYKFWYLEFEGDLFKVYDEEFDCYKMDWEKRTWIALKDEELRGICCYIHGSQVFMARGRKREIYDIRHLGLRNACEAPEDTYRSNKVESLLLERVKCESLSCPLLVELG